MFIVIFPHASLSDGNLKDHTLCISSGNFQCLVIASVPKYPNYCIFQSFTGVWHMNCMNWYRNHIHMHCITKLGVYFVHKNPHAIQMLDIN